MSSPNAADRQIIQIRPAEPVFVKRNDFQETREIFAKETLGLRIIHALVPAQIPLPEIQATFRLAEPSVAVRVAEGLGSMSVETLKETCVQRLQGIMQRNEPAAQDLIRSGYTVCLLKAAAETITQRRKEIIEKRSRASFRSRLDYLLGTAPL